MKVLHLKNFRKGFATNSSSTHSVIYQKKEDLLQDLNVMDSDYYERNDLTIAASKEAKIKYIAANIYKSHRELYDTLCSIYPSMKKYVKLIEKQLTADSKGRYDDIFGMACRGDLCFENNKYFLPSIEYIKKIIDDEDLVIVGGSDESNNYYELTKPREKFFDAGACSKIYKNGNYWVGYGYNGKCRLNLSEKDECIPEYPELIDLKITDMCLHGCPFCYMGSTGNGSHANIGTLKSIIYSINDDSTNDRCVEFSIGGGNILLYPDLDELFYFIKNNGHIVNTTINAKDCKELINNDSLFTTFNRYVTAIGVSITDESEIPDVVALYKKFYKGNGYKQMTAHLIPEYLGIEKSRNIVNQLYKNCLYSVLFLGYKVNGRGAKCDFNIFTDDELSKLFSGTRQPDYEVDTTFANQYYDWISKHFDIVHTITLKEGEFSMYIDGVKGLAYKSSYHLEKPYGVDYNLSKNSGIKFTGLLQAFQKIRKDNNLPTSW